MRKSFLVLSLLSCALLCGCAGAGSGPREKGRQAGPGGTIPGNVTPPRPTNNLELTIRTDKLSYKIDEPVEIEFRLTNIGRQFICAYSELHRGEG